MATPMRVLPKSDSRLIDFLAAHLDVWEADPGAIGLTAAEVAALRTLYESASAARTAALEARDAARAATASFREAASTARRRTAGAVARIKAAAADDPEVYAAAAIPAPRPPSPAPAPGVPYRFRTTLRQDGTVGLRWSCATPPGLGGTVYEVARSLGGGPFETLGVAGGRAFTDETLPPGGGGGETVYRVRALRSTGRGDPALHAVLFGSARDAPRAETATRLAA